MYEGPFVLQSPYAFIGFGPFLDRCYLLYLGILRDSPLTLSTIYVSFYFNYLCQLLWDSWSHVIFLNSCTSSCPPCITFVKCVTQILLVPFWFYFIILVYINTLIINIFHSPKPKIFLKVCTNSSLLSERKWHCRFKHCWDIRSTRMRNSTLLMFQPSPSLYPSWHPRSVFSLS